MPTMEKVALLADVTVMIVRVILAVANGGVIEMNVTVVISILGGGVTMMMYMKKNHQYSNHRHHCWLGVGILFKRLQDTITSYVILIQEVMEALVLPIPILVQYLIGGNIGRYMLC